MVQHKLTFGEEWVNYRLQKEGHALDGILLLFFYLLLHPLYGTLIEEGYQILGTVVVEEF